MLSRRQLRIKVLQALYAFFLSLNDRVDLGEKELLRSLDKLYEIYIYQLSLLIAIVDFAKKRIEENKHKFLPTEKDLHPNTRFIDNQFYIQLSQNRDLEKNIEKLKISWVDQEDMIRKIYIDIRESKDYSDYLDAESTSYESDKEIFIKIIKKHITNSEILRFFYEEKSIYWSDDFYTTNQLVIKTIKSYHELWDESKKLPSLLKGPDIEKTNEDKSFLINLFRRTIVKSGEYEKLIEEKARNWEMDRIAVMDILLIKMALAELIEFPSIPIKVTLNEYIELAKMYSTPKSKIFVNGILDKLILDLKSENKIKKTGRGLLDK